MTSTLVRNLHMALTWCNFVELLHGDEVILLHFIAMRLQVHDDSCPNRPLVENFHSFLQVVVVVLCNSSLSSRNSTFLCAQTPLIPLHLSDWTAILIWLIRTGPVPLQLVRHFTTTARHSCRAVSTVVNGCWQEGSDEADEDVEETSKRYMFMHRTARREEECTLDFCCLCWEYARWGAWPQQRRYRLLHAEQTRHQLDIMSSHISFDPDSQLENVWYRVKRFSVHYERLFKRF